MKKLIYFLVVTFLFVNIPVAYAETGTLTIDAHTTNTYIDESGGGANGATFLWTKMFFDSSNYNNITDILITFESDWVFAQDAKSTDFTITAGGTGGGTVTYNKNSKTAYFFFNTGKITSSPVTISYVSPILNDITGVATTVQKNVGAPGVNDPVYFAGTDGTMSSCSNVVNKGCSVQTNTFTAFSNNYNVTYSNGLANVSIDKSPSTVNSKIEIRNNTDQKFIETTFNTVSFSYAFLYDNGLILKMSDSAGDFDSVIVNSTGIPAQPGHAGTNQTHLTKPASGAVVGFDKPSYFVGDNVNISWYFSDDTWNDIYSKNLNIFMNGVHQGDPIDISTQSGYYIFQATSIGTLKAELDEVFFFVTINSLNSSSVQILPPGNSWIALNKTVSYAKFPVNVTYHIGFSVTSYPPSSIEIQAISIETGNIVDSVFPSIFPDGNINLGIVHPLPKGNYSIKLYDPVRNLYLDTKYLTMIVPEVSIPTQGITISNISTDKTLYFYNDFMTITFAVDDTNFSNYNYTLMGHVVALDKNGIVTKMIISPFQDQVGTFTTLVNIDKTQKCEQKLNCWFETGNNSVNIVLMNSTAAVTIAYANFTVSSTTVDGYGLQLSTTTPTSNTQFTITTTVPTLHTGRLRIVVAGTLGNISAIPDQTVNAGISTIPATISIVNTLDKAYYNVELYGDDGILKVRIPITVTQQAKPLTPSEINAMDKIDSWTALFGLGVNPTSKFIFGMMITLLIAACGVILVKNDRFIGAALFGAIPFLFFTYIAYFPIVVPVIVGIIIALKFRFL